MTELHDLAGAHVLDALDAEEQAAFERHLQTCAECRVEVAELREGAAWLGAAAEVTPPEELRGRVLAEIDQTSTSVDVVRLRPKTWRERAFVPALAVAAAVAFVLGGLLWMSLEDGPDPTARVLAAPDAQVTMLDGPVGTTARLVYSPSQSQGVLAMSGVADVPGSETYALWLIDEDGPTPAGLFRPVDGGVAFLVEGDFAGVTAVGITVEPAGGSPQPTGEILFLGTFS